MNRRGILTWIFSILLAALLLYFFFYKVNFAGVLKDTRGVSVKMIVLAVIFELVSILLRTYRWRVMLKSVRPKIPMMPILKATVVSFAITGVVPGRLGEVGKPFLLSRWEKLPFGPLLASVMLERSMDMVAILILWLFFVFESGGAFTGNAAEYMTILTRLSYLLLALSVLFGLFLWWLIPRRRVFDRIAKRSERLSRYRPLQKVVRKILGFAAGLGTFKKKRTILYVLFLSLVVWSCIVGSAWSVVVGMHLDIPADSAILILVFVSFGAAIPTPGGVGGVHKAIEIALVTFYGLSEELGVTAGIIGHAVMFFPSILWGLGYIALGRVGIGEIKLLTRAAASRKKGGDDSFSGSKA